MWVRIAMLALFGVPYFAAASEPVEGWYQVELIVFANRTAVATEQATSPEKIRPIQPHYPAQMVSIAPQSGSGLRPLTPGQMWDLESYLTIWEGSNRTNTVETDDPDEFFFQSRNSPGIDTPTATLETAADGLPIDVDFDELFSSTGPTAFKDLPAQQRLLKTEVRSIRRSSLYTLLLHRSWLQPLVAEEQTLPILIQAGERYGDRYELDGTISISRSRYLHLETDLWYTQFAPAADDGFAAEIVSLPGRDTELSASLRKRYPEVAEWLTKRDRYEPAVTHHIAQDRRMRSSKLHFIDHPQVGILLTTKRYEVEDSES